MGALTFQPRTQHPLTAQDVTLLDLAKKVVSLTAGASATVLNQLMLIGGSPHGARPKALVVYERNSGRMTTGIGVQSLNGAGDDDGGEPWLIKFPARGEHPEVCAIEELYARMARRCGIDMPDTELFRLRRGLSAFGVKRFDREGGMRVPVQTLAGALHADFRVPSVDAIDFVRLTRLMTSDVREVRKAFAHCVFNLVFNNRDDHAKNFSYRLGPDRRWRLSPAYDLTFSVGLRGHHQMSYSGETLEPSLRSLFQVAEKGGIDAVDASAIIKRTVRVAASLQKQAGTLPIRKATLRHIVKTVAGHGTRLRL
jgi:serine/threonine-protein kinase HipA